MKDLEEGRYNLRVGPARVGVAGSLQVEFDDNINYVDESPQSDGVVYPQVDFRTIWKVSRQNQLNLSVLVGYLKYIDHSEYDRVTLGSTDTSSEVSFDMYAGDFRFTAYDRFSYRFSPVEIGSLSGVADYGGFDNTIGLDTTVDLNEVVLTVGYGYNTFLSDNSDYTFQDRNSHQVLGRVTFMPSRPILYGLEATLSQNAYTESYLNDNLQLSYGAFIHWPISRLIDLTVRGGMVAFDFDSTGANAPPKKPDDYYFSAEARHRLNRWFAHRVMGQQSVDLGFYSDVKSVFQAGYGVEFGFVKKLPLRFQLIYERGDEPGFVIAPKYDRIGAVFSVEWMIVRHTPLTFAVHHWERQSDADFFVYKQNQIIVGITHQF